MDDVCCSEGAPCNLCWNLLMADFDTNVDAARIHYGAGNDEGTLCVLCWELFSDNFDAHLRACVEARRPELRDEVERLMAQDHAEHALDYSPTSPPSRLGN